MLYFSFSGYVSHTCLWECHLVHLPTCKSWINSPLVALLLSHTFWLWDQNPLPLQFLTSFLRLWLLCPFHWSACLICFLDIYWNLSSVGDHPNSQTYASPSLLPLLLRLCLCYTFICLFQWNLRSNEGQTNFCNLESLQVGFRKATMGCLGCSVG